MSAVQYLLEEGAGEGRIGEAYATCEGSTTGRSSVRRTVCLHDDVVESVAVLNETLHHVDKVTTGERVSECVSLMCASLPASAAEAA